MLRQSVSSTAQREQVNSNTHQNVVADCERLGATKAIESVSV